jgi:hypothetical protein
MTARNIRLVLFASANDTHGCASSSIPLVVMTDSVSVIESNANYVFRPIDALARGAVVGG